MLHICNAGATHKRIRRTVDRLTASERSIDNTNKSLRDCDIYLLSEGIGRIRRAEGWLS